MSLTADLQFFKCDLCGTYFHHEIFCDHRRLCNGPDSKELNRKEADKIAAAMDTEEARRRAEKRAGAAVPLTAVEKQRDNRTRTALARDVDAEEQAAIRKKLQAVNVDALMAELEGL